MKTNKKTIKLTEGTLKRLIKESIKQVMNEGWVDAEVQPSEEIYNEIISDFPKDYVRARYRRIIEENGSLYGFFGDYIKDSYDVTLQQNNEICERLREFYAPMPFYYNER